MTGFFAGLCKCIKPDLDGQGSGKESSTNGHNGPRLVSGSQPRVDAQVGFNLGEAPALERFRPISSTSASSAFTEGAPQSNSAENGTRHHPDQSALDPASQHAKEHAAKPELQSPANKDLAYGEMRTSADNAVGSPRQNFQAPRPASPDNQIPEAQVLKAREMQVERGPRTPPRSPLPPPAQAAAARPEGARAFWTRGDAQAEHTGRPRPLQRKPHNCTAGQQAEAPTAGGQHEVAQSLSATAPAPLHTASYKGYTETSQAEASSSLESPHAAPSAHAASSSPPQASLHATIRNALDSKHVGFGDGEEESDPFWQKMSAGFVCNMAGEWVLSLPIEHMIQDEIEAVHHCMLVCHETSDEIGCLLTLRAAPRSAGLALDHAGLQLANKSGSEAATVMSARQCALFRRGLALELEYINHHVVQFKVQVRRFQVLRDDLTIANGMLFASNELNRPAIVRRYRHIINDMFHCDARYPSKWMGRQETAAHEAALPLVTDASPADDMYASRSQSRGHRHSTNLIAGGGRRSGRNSPARQRSPSPSSHFRAPTPPACQLSARRGEPPREPQKQLA